MDSQNGLRYLQFLPTNYNDVACSTPSLGSLSACQYPSETGLYSNGQQSYSGATVSSSGYNDYLYGYPYHQYTGQYFSNEAAATANDYYNSGLFYGYSSSSGCSNATIPLNGSYKESCSTSSRKNSGIVQRANRTSSKRRKVGQTSSSAEMTAQTAMYPEMTSQSDSFLERTVEGTIYPEKTTNGVIFPENTTQNAIYPEMTAQNVTYPEVTTHNAIYPGMTPESSSSPEMTTETAISPEMSHESLTQTTPISFYNSGESHATSYSASLMPHYGSLKKRNVDTNNSCERTKAKSRKCVKRNLKYSPVSSDDWRPQKTRESSACINSTEFYTHGDTEYYNLALSAEDCEDRNNFDSLRDFTDNSNNLKYGRMNGTGIQNNGEDTFRRHSPDTVYPVPQHSPDAVCPVSNATHRAPYDNSAIYFNDYPSNKSSEISDDHTTSEGADNNTEDNEEEITDPEDEEIPVGAPVRFEDYLEQLQINPLDFRTEQIPERCPVVCKGCFHKTSGRKTSSTKSSEILSRLLQDNGAAKTWTVKENADLISYADTMKKHCFDSGKCEAVKGNATPKTSESSKDMVKASSEEITLRPSPEDQACSQSQHEWVERSIEVAGDLNHSSHLCFGCQKPVFDRYVIQVKDHGFWHADCLKCSNCQDNLSDQKSCYVKNEQVFCRNDYNILFGLSCVKCSLQFKREQDWMRVAGQHRYHIACFLCKICKRQLGNNEKYHLVNGTDIYCTNHYRDMVNGESSDGQQPPKKAKRNRTSYTEAQIKFLQDRFLRDSNPDGNELEKIATHINLKKRVVQVWFQNNRARLKKSANNSKNGNQENKNPINSGVAGNSSLNDAMSIDWDNSLEQSSLDEHTYPNSASPSQMRPGSAHFMDTAYSLTPALSGPLLCLPSGVGASAIMGQESGSLGDGSGSGTSTCGTPRDQISPHFSELSNPAYQGNESTVAGAVGRTDNSADDVAGNISSDYPSSVTVCGNKSATSPSVILSALRSSVVRDKFSEGCQRRMDTRDHQEEMRHHMMLFQDQSLRQHPHFHQQPYHSDLMYGPHMGLYGNIYNMYNSYGHLASLSGDQNSELPDSHQNFLRMKTDQSQNSGHQVAEQPFDCHFSDSSHIFGRSHFDINGGFSSTRASLVDTNCHASTGNTGSSGNSSPLSFLGAPNSHLHPRPSSGQCSFIQGHQISSPAACGQGHNYARPGCGSPGLIAGQNGGPSLQSLARSGSNYFAENENA